MTSFIVLFTFLLLIHVSFSVSTKTIPVKDPNNILFTFGSCNKYYGDEPDDIFYKVADLKPDVWAWLGDVAYVDEKIMPPIFGYAGEEKIKEKLHNAKTSPPYVALRKATNVIGVWDDHDYGLNNAGRSFQHKNLTQQLWLDFIDEPSDSPRRQRKGVYESYYIGDSSKVKVILLDVRYFREDNSVFKGKKNTDALGDEQWAWLENELKENKAQYVVIGSGVQILPDDRVFPENFYDESRDRLIGLIKKYKVSGVILISGDVHFAEILKHPCPQKIGFELYEITSSGLTHHVSTHVPFADQYVKTVLPDTWSTADDRYCDLNFGVIHFTFGKDGKAKCELKDVNGKTVLHQDIAYNQLQIKEKSGDEKATECIADRHRHVRFVENYVKAIFTGKWYPIAVLALISFAVMGIVSLFKFIFKLPGRLYRLFSPVPPKKVKQA